jgi:archaellum component FlaF (FlaF/FlaG flagellin family)
MTIDKIKRNKKGLSTVAAVFMLLLMFTAMIGLIIAFSNYNLSANEQMELDHQRSQEKITLTKIELDNESQTIKKIEIKNTGSIEVEIRAIYQTANGETILLFDPASYTESQIAPTQTLVIDIPTSIPDIFFDEEAKIIAATERGTKTLDSVPELVYGPTEPPTNYDPTKLYVGPLMLKFDDFFYHKTDSKGNLDPDETWKPGWIVDEKGYYAWNITVMNIDDRDLTIYRFSSFNLVPTSSPSVLSWYIEPTGGTYGKQLLVVNETATITYIWDQPLSNDAAKLTFSDCTCMVFLTFFGVFHEVDGTETPYAQTIPFEASVTVR